MSTRLAARLDQLDGALSLCNAIRSSKEFDSRLYHLNLQRRAPMEHSGVFRVIAEFNSMVDSLPFEAGALVDDTLIGQGYLQRLTAGRYLMPVSLESAAA